MANCLSSPPEEWVKRPKTHDAKGQTFYNLIFPLWVALFLPRFIYVLLLGNLLIDGLLILAVLSLSRIKLPPLSLGSLILKAWGAGFAADLVGAAVLLTLESLVPVDAYRFWTSLTSILSYLLAITAAALLIWACNRKFARQAGVSPQAAKRLALVMALLTAPWMFLIPTPSTWFMGL